MVGVLVAAAFLFRAEPVPAQPAAATPPTVGTSSPLLPPPLAEGPAPDLDLVFTAQVIGWIEPCG